MSVTATLLPDGSVSICDGGVTYAPLSPEAVQVVSQQAAASANANKTRVMTETLMGLAQLITAAGQMAGASAYAQVTVTPGVATAVVDPISFQILAQSMPGGPDSAGNWVCGPLTVSPQICVSGSVELDGTAVAS